MRVLCRTTDYVRWGGSGSDKIRLQRCLTKTKTKKQGGNKRCILLERKLLSFLYDAVDMCLNSTLIRFNWKYIMVKMLLNIFTLNLKMSDRNFY